MISSSASCKRVFSFARLQVLQVSDHFELWAHLQSTVTLDLIVGKIEIESESGASLKV